MRYSEYGKTGKRVSAVGFGGMRFDTDRPDEENVELMLHARQRGVNYFDTAPGYNGGKSEEIFGQALAQMSGEWYVSTKAMPVTADTAEKAREAVCRSLERMRLDHIHFYHIWCVRKMEHYELAMKPGGQYEGLLACREEGLIDHIVISTHLNGREIRQIVSEGKVEGVLLGLNVLNFPYRWDGVAAAKAAGCGVVAMNPLGGGLIPRQSERLGFLAEPGRTPAEAALQFVLGCEEINTALVGFTTKEQVDFACRVAESAGPMAPERLEEIRARLHEGMAGACTACGYCEPCPVGVPIAAYMMFYNRKQVFGASDAEMIEALPGERRWQTLASRRADASACTACGRCEKACTQKIDIIDRLAEIARWEEKIPEDA
jgi:hypothetical protein